MTPSPQQEQGRGHRHAIAAAVGGAVELEAIRKGPGPLLRKLTTETV